MQLDLSDAETLALLNLLIETIEADRLPYTSPRIRRCGHVNLINRPNTWRHRPATRREDFPCQLGAVHTWH